MIKFIEEFIVKLLMLQKKEVYDKNGKGAI